MYAPDGLKWNTDELADGHKFNVCHDFDKMVGDIISTTRKGDVILIMSNGGFGGIQAKLLEGLKLK